MQAAGLDGAKVACRHAVAWSDDNAHNALRSWKLLRSCGKARDLHHGKLLTAQSRRVRGMLSSTKASFVGATLFKNLGDFQHARPGAPLAQLLPDPQGQEILKTLARPARALVFSEPCWLRARSARLPTTGRKSPSRSRWGWAFVSAHVNSENLRTLRAEVSIYMVW